MHSWTPRLPTQAEETKALKVCEYMILVYEYLEVLQRPLELGNVSGLVKFCVQSRPGMGWPFGNDSLDELDALREALKTMPRIGCLDMNLESLGLGFFDVPDMIPSMMRSKGIGLKESLLRVYGEARQCPCQKCTWYTAFAIINQQNTS